MALIQRLKKRREHGQVVHAPGEAFPSVSARQTQISISESIDQSGLICVTLKFFPLTTM